MRKRPFQFSLRTLLMLFVVAALLLGQAVVPIRREWRRVEARRKLEKLGASISTEPYDLGWMGIFLPEEAAEVVVAIDFGNIGICHPPYNGVDIDYALRAEVHPIDENLALLRWFPEVRKLALAGSKYSDVGFQEVESLEKLEEFYARGDKTRIDDRSLVHLAKLPHLTILDLSGSQVTGLGFTQYNFSKKLKDLSLDHCPVTDESVEAISRFRELKGLGLSDTKITDKGLIHLKDLHALESLGLYDTEIQGEGLRHLKSLKKLKSLSLSGSKITDSNLKYVKEFRNLEELFIINTSISDASIPHLMTLTNLRVLFTKNSKLTKKGRQSLRKLPHMEYLSPLDTYPGQTI